MNPLPVWVGRLAAFFTFHRDEARFEEEISAHLDFLASEFERRGMTPAEARLAARREFGGIAQIREVHREQRIWPLAESVFRDFRHALGQIRRGPALASVTIAALALGIGANAIIYQAFDYVFFRPLPVAHPEQLAILHLGEKVNEMAFDYPLYRYLNQHQNVAGSLFARGFDEVPVAGSSDSLAVFLVTGNYFDGMGVPARLGRVLTPADDRPDAPPVAVLSHAYWQKHFSGSPGVLGQAVRVGNTTATVVGIAPPEFFGDILSFEPDVWAPIVLQPRIVPDDWRDKSDTTWLSVMARLRPGVSRKQAQAALNGLYHQLRKDRTHRALTLSDGSRGIPLMQEQMQGLVGALMALVAIVLLIACCNLANLLLGRGTARVHEIGVRLALGAGRPRVVRQMLTESLALAAIGAAAAWLLASWGWRLIVGVVPLPRMPGSLGWHTLLFTAAAAALATCLFGLTPALAATGIDLRSALAAGGRSHTGAHHRQRLGRTLVAVQLSVSLLLVYGAFLLGRSLWTLQHRDLGFQPQGVLMTKLRLEAAQFNLQRDESLYAPLFERLNGLPGVQSAALTGGGPMSDYHETPGLSTPGRAPLPDNEAHVAHVTPRYFEAMGIRILAGRPIGSQDRQGTPPAAVISETAARHLFGAANPIGQSVCFGTEFDARHALQVVGIAHDIRFSDAHENFGSAVYVALAQSPIPISSLVIRSAGSLDPLETAVRGVVKEAAPSLRIAEISPLADIIDLQFTNESAMAFFSSGFGILALALTSLGIYGVVRYAMALRTREIGIRLALGATHAAVERMVLREFSGLAAVSALVGTVAALAGARVLRSAVASLGSNDWILLAAAACLLAGVAALAAWLPARRAARLDPMGALRQE